LPEVSWLFFKAVRAGLAVKHPYLSHTGRSAAAEEKQPTGPLGETYRRIGESACRRFRSIINSVEISWPLQPCRKAVLLPQTPIRRHASAGTTVVVRPGVALSVRTREIGARQTSRISKIADELRNSLHFYADRLDLGVELNCFSTHFATPT
jgi:hypothetical protein